MNDVNCPLCGISCKEADFGPLLHKDLRWLWAQIGQAADRRGDPVMSTGKIRIDAPESVEERVSAGGLLGERILKAGQRREIDLESLTRKLRARGDGLTPGAVAAHALNRRLAERAEANSERRRQENLLRNAFVRAIRQAKSAALADEEGLWLSLRRRGTVGRLLNSTAPLQLLSQAVAVVAGLPSAGKRKDRRHLANVITLNPHALDHGTQLASTVMAILLAAGRVGPGLRPRDAWSVVGVDCDDVLGGLTMIGIAPSGCSIPSNMLITIPPHVLNTCEWPRCPNSNNWIFVTENPSVLLAATELAEQGTMLRLICTCGTPSATEINALARLSRNGWRLAIRADFDAAGIEHMNSLLTGIAGAVPWRMTSSDYLNSVHQEGADEVKLQSVANTPWDLNLSKTMVEIGRAAFEESLLSSILEDLLRGSPIT